jgi:hypothetical protein
VREHLHRRAVRLEEVRSGAAGGDAGLCAWNTRSYTWRWRGLNVPLIGRCA